MKNAELHKVDATKAALFVMLALILMTLMAFMVYIPDVRQLKVAHMAKERADIALQQTQADYKMRQNNLQKTREENARSLEMLENHFADDRFHRDAVGHFARFEIAAGKKEMSDRFEINEYNVTAELREPTDFYDFMDFLNRYQNAVEVDFPISVKADDRYLLNWKFNLKVYHTQPDQPRSETNKP